MNHLLVHTLGSHTFPLSFSLLFVRLEPTPPANWSQPCRQTALWDLRSLEQCGPAGADSDIERHPNLALQQLRKQLLYRYIEITFSNAPARDPGIHPGSHPGELSRPGSTRDLSQHRSQSSRHPSRQSIPGSMPGSTRDLSRARSHPGPVQDPSRIRPGPSIAGPVPETIRDVFTSETILEAMPGATPGAP